jgi:NADPH-dependent curcumin reductase CurA
MPGATVYGGLVETLRPLKGETIFISAAAGAVGSLVGQLAKSLYDCKVIGSCGGPEKAKLIKEEFGFDYAIDYKALNGKDDLVAALKAAAPNGINMYFENVGGIHFAAAMDVLAPRGRVAVCGQIENYNDSKPHICEFQPMRMIYTSQRIEGFISFDWLADPKAHWLS